MHWLLDNIVQSLIVAAILGAAGIARQHTCRSSGTSPCLDRPCDWVSAPFNASERSPPKGSPSENIHRREVSRM